ncbi:MAG: M20 family metallopeptidase [Candidatus Lokiarchaeota archaeon]|nr:M20 family metallopeptidase [Candidatus Lokiarchaeota archaeon]
MSEDLDVAKLAGELVAIPSDPPRHPETGVAEYLKALFEGCGCPCIEIPTRLGPGRHDLLVLNHDPGEPLDPSNDGGGLLFSAHMDVVPPGDPSSWEGGRLDPWIDGEGYLHGRGAVDMKGGMAAFVSAFLKNIDGVTRDRQALIGLLFTVDEETSLAGASAFVASPHARLFGRAILPEPTGLQPVRGHKGVLFMRFTVRGKAAHGAVPERGVNAIQLAMSMYGAIEAEFKRVLEARTHPVLGRPTLNLGILSGGQKVNVVPDSCTFSIDRRVNPGETTGGVIREILAAAGGRPLPAGASASHEVINERPPYYLPDGNDFLQEVCALTGPPATMNGYTEAGIYYNDGHIPTVILGPGTIDSAHVANEKVSVAELEAAERIYARIMLDHSNRKGRPRVEASE